MAHFAKLNDLNIVETVLVVDNINLMSHENIEEEEIGIQYLKNIFGENTRWVQTSYNSNFRVRLAQHGFFTMNKGMHSFHRNHMIVGFFQMN